MSRLRSPSDKKRLSLSRDRRNNYGENAKASRKNIPASKARSSRAERRTVQQVVFGAVLGCEADNIEAEARNAGLKKARAKFRKWPDESLADALQRKLARRLRTGQGRAGHVH